MGGEAKKQTGKQSKSEKEEICFRLPPEDWKVLKKWLDAWDNVLAALGSCPQAYLLNMSKIRRRRKLLKGEVAGKNEGGGEGL